MNVDNVAVFFSPQNDTQAEFLKLLEASTTSIYLADYSFNIMPVVDVLIAKYQAGVDVKLVLDKSQSAGKSEVPEVTALHNANVPTTIVESIDHKIMHNKYTVIDHHICQAGSWNYTGAASDENNFYFVIDNPDLAQVFEKDFMDMWNHITTIKEA